MDEVTQRVVEFLKSTGLNQTQLEEKTKIKQGNISKILNGVRPAGEGIVNKLVLAYNANKDWFLTGNGDVIVQKHHNPPYNEAVSDEETPLFSVDAAANLKTLFDNKNQNIIGFIKIPNLPKCDGAIYVRGDSMYPLLKSGDIAIFKEVHSFENVVFGEMYIVDYHFNGDDYLVVKFVTKSEINNHIQLVSYNTHHSPADIPINCIRAMAIVKASVRLNTMI